MQGATAVPPKRAAYYDKVCLQIVNKLIIIIIIIIVIIIIIIIIIITVLE